MDAYYKPISGSLVFRKACESDIPAAADILKKAARRMMAEGKRQWNENYPNETHVKSDLADGIGYVLVSDTKVIGYAAVVFTGEPAYEALDGKWLADLPYVVVHRIAVSQDVKGKGYGLLLLQTIADYARSLGTGSFRIDTNFDNSAMLGLLDRLGFTYCGDVEYRQGSRMAFEKLL